MFRKETNPLKHPRENMTANSRKMEMLYGKRANLAKGKGDGTLMSSMALQRCLVDTSTGKEVARIRRPIVFAMYDIGRY